ncbi:AAA domain-containing protein [Trichoderma barbatum]
MAKGIAVDEAGNISRPDLYSVWGNTLLPCLLCGDDKQLTPQMMSFEQKDDQGYCINRFHQDGKVSALLFFKMTGWPVFRLRTQLRMATGLFDLCHAEVYNDVPFEYGPSSDINLDRHMCGRELEDYLQKRFSQLVPPPPDNLRAAFIHCRGSECLVDAVTGWGWNPIQSEHALDFIRDLVTCTAITPTDISIITPYRAGVEFIEQTRKKPQYRAISAMQPAATIDAFQGLQWSIIIVVMTATQETGAGYTSDAHLLNVMLSRHTSGLVIFGDSDVLGKPVENGGRGLNRTDWRRVAEAREGEDRRGEKAPMLGNILGTLKKQGRVVTIDAPS